MSESTALRKKNDDYFSISYRSRNPYDTVNVFRWRTPPAARLFTLRTTPPTATTPLAELPPAARSRSFANQAFLAQLPWDVDRGTVAWLLVTLGVTGDFNIRMKSRSSRSPAKRSTGMWFVDFENDADLTLCCRYHHRIMFHEVAISVWESADCLLRWCARRDRECNCEGLKPVVIEASYRGSD